MAVASTFLLTMVGWVLFRADNIGDAMTVYRALVGNAGFDLGWVAANGMALAVLGATLLLCVVGDSYDLEPQDSRGWAAAYAAVAAICVLKLEAPSAFIYYQF